MSNEMDIDEIDAMLRRKYWLKDAEVKARENALVPLREARDAIAPDLAEVKARMRVFGVQIVELSQGLPELSKERTKIYRRLNGKTGSADNH